MRRRRRLEFVPTLLLTAFAVTVALIAPSLATTSAHALACLPDLTYAKWTDATLTNSRIFLRIDCGATEEQLTIETGPALDSRPRISPDGTAVVFLRTTPSSTISGGKARDWFVVSTQPGSVAYRLTDTPSVWKSQADWSPDSKHVVYDASPNPSNGQIYTVNRDGSGVTQITSGPDANDATPCWSLQNQIAFARYKLLPTGAFVTNWVIVNPDGTNLRTVTNSPDENTFCSWSPDGRYLFYDRLVDRNTGAEATAVADVTTGQTALLPGAGQVPTVANDWTVADGLASFGIGLYDYASATSSPLYRGFDPSFARSGPVTAPPAGFPPIGLGGPTPSPSPTGTPPGPPQNVTGTASASRGINLTWDPPVTGGPVDHYRIVRIVNGAPAGDAGTSTGTSFTVTGLRNCSYYQYGVIAVGADAQESDPAEITGNVFTQGPPNKPPPVVTIIAQGVGSYIAGGSFNPVSVDDYCTTRDGVTLQTWPSAEVPLAGMVGGQTPPGPGGWIGASDGHMAPYGADSNIVDAAASGGGVVLPFSYSGATLESGPVFKFTGYTASTVANSSPATMAKVMNAEIMSIHAAWPRARIVVVGHSNGGLVAEQWWLNYGAKNRSGVTQVFALDSPLNGVANRFCSSVVSGYLCDKIGGVGKTLSDFYAMLWKDQVKNDAAAVALDAKDRLFTAVGTDGDPLYDAADYSIHNKAGIHGQIGDVSQFFYPSSCAGSAYTASCLPVGRWYMDPCSPLSDGSAPTFGAPGDLWMHSVVKNCVIAKLMQYIG